MQVTCLARQFTIRTRPSGIGIMHIDARWIRKVKGKGNKRLKLIWLDGSTLILPQCPTHPPSPFTLIHHLYKHWPLQQSPMPFDRNAGREEGGGARSCPDVSTCSLHSCMGRGGLPLPTPPPPPLYHHHRLHHPVSSHPPNQPSSSSPYGCKPAWGPDHSTHPNPGAKGTTTLPSNNLSIRLSLSRVRKCTTRIERP